LKKSIDNRYIYSSVLSSQRIARGFEISKIAPRVSVFSAALARYLLMTYAPESSTVLDPFSGFSGRLLGAASLDKAYIGFDVSEKVVQESKQIVDFLKLSNVSVSVKDIRKPCAITYPEADVLLTCPPYGLKESWEEVPPNMLLDSTDDYIDLVLSKCCAKTYLFIVDETLKYSPNIVQNLKRRSHLREDGNELVLLFKKS
jgi:DNA modification methylase